MKNTPSPNSIVFPSIEEIPENFQIKQQIEQKTYLINGEMRAWHGATQEVFSPIYINNNKQLKPQTK